MLSFRRRYLFAVLLAALFVYLFSSVFDVDLRYHFSAAPAASLPDGRPYPNLPADIVDWDDGKFHWAHVEQHYPPRSLRRLPRAKPRGAPIQHQDWHETPEQRATREQRRNAVLGNFTHAWAGYKKYAWLKDEAGPLTGKVYDSFGGWAASLVDGLDTLWIMGLKDEFDEAVAAIDTIDFSTCSLKELNVFETIIRYMGGLMAAYDLSGESNRVLLRKILELGEMVYKAFDTPNRMPITRWDFENAKAGNRQTARTNVIVAEIASFSLEMTRLSQITGDDRFYDTAARITEALRDVQMSTGLPGMFPTMVNAQDLSSSLGYLFTIGGMVDSLYEYLPKTHLLLGGGTGDYRLIYSRAMAAIREHILYRPMTPDARDIVLAGQARVVHTTSSEVRTSNDHEAQHLGCFVGGMIGLGARAFGIPSDVELGLRAARGCAWAYETAPRGVMPEVLHTQPCPSSGACDWDEAAWKEGVGAGNSGLRNADATIEHKRLPRGVTRIDSPGYYLRPEAIESVFVMYRLTGDAGLADSAWRMFEAVVALTHTDIGAAAVDDVTVAGAVTQSDKMESFWFAETLKYFYLVFCEPDVVSLDDWVLNTEAHPLKRPGGGGDDRGVKKPGSGWFS